MKRIRECHAHELKKIEGEKDLKRWYNYVLGEK